MGVRDTTVPYNRHTIVRGHALSALIIRQRLQPKASCNFVEPGAPTHPQNGRVELDVVGNGGRRVVRPCRQFLEGFRLAPRYPPAQQPRRQAFDYFAKIEYLGDLHGAERVHECPLVGDRDHQPVLFEHPQGVPHRRTAHSELRREPGLDERIPGKEDPFEYPVPQDGVGDAAGRLSLSRSLTTSSIPGIRLIQLVPSKQALVPSCSIRAVYHVLRNCQYLL